MNELSIIIPYTYSQKDRDEALYKCLDSVEKQVFKDFELIVVEEVIGNNVTKFKGHRRVNNHIVLKDDRPFNKSWIINVAARQATTKYMFVLDADSILTEKHLSEVFMYKVNQPQFKFFCGYLYLRLLPGKDNPNERMVSSKHLEAVGGAWFCDINFFFNILGGMNENYFGYGAEDNDMWFRVQHWYKHSFNSGVDYPIPMLPINMIHQYHDWAPFTHERYDMLNKTRNHPDIVINRLIAAQLGKSFSPTIIETDDILIEHVWYK